MELPAIEREPAIEPIPSINQQGSERNPEYLPNAQTSAQPLAPPDDSSSLGAASSQPDPQSTITSDSSPTNTSLAAGTPSIADDIDLIEKEWVEKAKEIVDKTRDNPYLQNKAIGEIKVDYIKKRYNKNVLKSD